MSFYGQDYDEGGNPVEPASQEELPDDGATVLDFEIGRELFRQRARREAARRLDAEEAAAATGDESGASWRPVDLGPILRGEHVRAEPTLGLARSDGLRLIYAAKEHSVIGEMEGGKSWFLVMSAVAELADGHHVVYIHGEETDPVDTVERMVALGAPDRAISERFQFIGPIEPATPEWLAALLDPPPSLVIFDGVNELMSLHAMGIREEDGAAAFRRRLIKPCTAVGAATLAADHVIKDGEKRGRYALGSIHKGNGLNGALFLLENAEPFGRGMRGHSRLYVTKDRPGHLRRHGKPDRKLPGKTYLGELVVDDTRQLPDIDLMLWAPKADTPDAQGEPGTDVTIDDLVMEAVARLAIKEKPATLRNVRASMPGFRAVYVDDALTRLVLNDRLTETEGKRGSRIFTVSPTVSQDQPPESVP